MRIKVDAWKLDMAMHVVYLISKEKCICSNYPILCVHNQAKQVLEKLGYPLGR